MDVFLVPLGDDRHELYCEVPDAPAVGPDELDERDGTPDETTFMGRMRARYVTPLVGRAHAAIADAEREWRDRQAGRLEEPSGRWGRAKAKLRAWVAEKVAEQRLLWHMRRQDACTLFHAADTTPDAAMALMREGLQRDYERHRRWFALHSLFFILSAFVAIVPGPNLLAYYFLFRLAGHYLSLKGARRGLDRVDWTPRACPELTELRAAAALPAPERAERVRAIAAALGLEHFATFFNRLAAV
ncbi:MAG TPA: hypothetical protein VMN81_01015 [Vicinamibacterales bacterium]|nr:hypothetical protein [Vicinamibacterales bacterium]